VSEFLLTRHFARSEQGQIDGVCHRLVTCIVGVQVVATVKLGYHSCRLAGIAHDRVEIDRAVICAARADERVDRLALRLLLKARRIRLPLTWPLHPESGYSQSL